MLVTTNFSVTVYLRLGVAVGVCVCFGFHCAIGLLMLELCSSHDRFFDARTFLEECNTPITKSQRSMPKPATKEITSDSVEL